MVRSKLPCSATGGSIPSSWRSLIPRGSSLTLWSLLALVLGLGAGIALYGSTAPWVGSVAHALEVLGGYWITALRVLVLPIVVTQAFAAVVGSQGLGRLGAKSILLFVVMLAAGALFAVLVTPPLLALYHPDPVTVEALRASTPIPDAARQVLQGSEWRLGQWLAGYVPRGVTQFLAGAGVLPLLLLTLFLGLLARLLPGSRQEAVRQRARWCAEATMWITGWLLILTPIGVLALCFGLARGSGSGAAGLVTVYVLVYAVVNGLFILMLYPLTALLGKTSMRQFAKAVAPAQLVAVSTRSSIAALPALVAGGRTHLGLPVSATGFVLPLSVSTVKVSLTVGVTLKVIFLAHLFGIHVSPAQIVSLGGILLLMNFTTVGLPSGGGPFRTLPAYVAVGMPIEGVVILEAVDLIPDIFKTVVNVTADLSIATLLSRPSRANPA